MNDTLLHDFGLFGQLTIMIYINRNFPPSACLPKNPPRADSVNDVSGLVYWSSVMKLTGVMELVGVTRFRSQLNMVHEPVTIFRDEETKILSPSPAMSAKL